MVDARDNLLRDCSGINVLWVKSVTQSGDAGCDLVELDTLLASIYGEYKLMSLEKGHMVLLTALIDVHVCCTLQEDVWKGQEDGNKTEWVALQFFLDLERELDCSLLNRRKCSTCE